MDGCRLCDHFAHQNIVHSLTPEYRPVYSDDVIKNFSDDVKLYK